MWQKLQNVIFIIFLILVFVSILLYLFLVDESSLAQLRISVSNFGISAPLIFIVFYTLGTIFIPSTPFMALAGILFGFKYGLVYTIIGGFLSSIIIFAVSRKLGQEKIEKFLSYRYLRHLNKYNERLEKGAVWDLILLRVVPIMPFNVLNILMGVSRIKTEEYVIGTLIGLIPSNILTVYFGNFITKIF